VTIIHEAFHVKLPLRYAAGRGGFLSTGEDGEMSRVRLEEMLSTFEVE
jgi:hypothetical protein